MESNSIFGSKEVQECLARILDQALANNAAMADRLKAVKASKVAN